MDDLRADPLPDRPFAVNGSWQSGRWPRESVTSSGAAVRERSSDKVVTSPLLKCKAGRVAS
jgi:hypothetical protein